MTQVEGGGVPAGTQLNGIYEVEKRIAIGGMGEVYIGRVIQTGDKVAIKMILPEHANNEIILDLFRREASTLHNLYHEAIVRYYVFSVDPVLNRPYLSMEFAAGPSLGERLGDGGPLNEHEMTVMRRRVAGGLHAAHKLGVIHRDISPDNIILVGGDVERAKIIDFGIAKTTTNEGTLIGSGFAGKLNYVSPEQLGLEGGEVTGKSDIYSLGLVFAQAVLGRPLPMGGSQVEVIEKRRAVPDLSELPDWIRPLIEWMIQPSPHDRPADMQAVADWSPAGAAAALPNGGPSQPVHPRERRRQQEHGGERRKGAPWLWIGIGGAGIAAAAAAFVLIGTETGEAPDTGPLADAGTLAPVPDGGTLAPADVVRVTAPAPSVTAPPARAGESYAWTSSPFDYDGDPGELAFTAEGALPPGISLGAVPSGAANLSGTPAEAGDYAFAIVAAAPGGESARMDVTLAVAEADRLALAQPPATPATPAGELTPRDGDSAAPPLDVTDSDRATLSPGGAPTLAPATGAGGAPVPPPADVDPTADSAEPTIALAAPGDLAAPAAGNEAGSLATAGAGSTPVTGQSAAPALTPSAGAGGLPAVPPSDTDPTADAAEPTVPSSAPGSLLAPAVQTNGTAVGASDGDALPLPRTGVNQPQLPAGADAGGGGQAIASIPSSGNQPPTLESAAPDTLSVAQGQPVNARLGSFFDEEGPSALSLRVEGTVPNGLAIRMAEGGVAQLYGTPAEFGDYEIRVAAVDPQGLVSQPIPLSLSIAPPAENKAVRDYILGYDGGDCFLSRPMELGPRLAQIEVFASEDKVQPVIDFDAAFKRDIGFEASIGMRPISPEQCPLIHALDQVGAQALDNSLVIHLERDELASGDSLTGKIRGGQGASLFLYDHLGGLTDLTRYVESKGGETGFSVPVSATGPQILVAARPREGADLSGPANLEALLGAAKRGQASLALGFFIMK